MLTHDGRPPICIVARSTARPPRLLRPQTTRTDDFASHEPSKLTSSRTIVGSSGTNTSLDASVLLTVPAFTWPFAACRLAPQKPRQRTCDLRSIDVGSPLRIRTAEVRPVRTYAVNEPTSRAPACPIFRPFGRGGMPRRWSCSAGQSLVTT
jgi:hypothetical protein